MQSLIRCLLVVAALGCSPVYAAAIQVINSDGVLTGATGVDVGGILFDVEFVEGSCASLFGGCTESSFAFSTPQEAAAAAGALLDQVFIGVFDSDPGLTFGCPTSLSSLSLCRSFIPFALLPNDRVSTGIAENSEPVPGFASDSFSSNSSFELGFDSASSISSNFARFTPSSSVPSPAALPLLAFGLTALGWFRRRKAQVMPVVVK